MRSTIDAAGRVVIPKPIRVRLGLTEGVAIEIHERDGTIEIEAAPTPMSLVESGEGAVAVPQHEIPPLTDDLVRATLERTRR